VAQVAALVLLVVREALVEAEAIVPLELVTEAQELLGKVLQGAPV
jgi:hypothetical protein